MSPTGADGGALKGKVAVVTGGTRGIGEATVHRLAREGARIGILARQEQPGRTVQEAVRAAGGKALFVACDVTRRPSVEQAVARIVEAYGVIDVLVNNAGGAAPHEFPDAADDAWDEAIRVNLTGTYLMCQVAWPHLVAAGSASIVNISSITVVFAPSEAQRALLPRLPAQPERLPMQVPPGYVAAKAGVEAFTRYLASAGAPHRIRANALRLGLIRTPSVTDPTTGAVGWGPLMEQVQLTRGLGEPDDVAGAVLFLASSASRFINAQVIDVDGGAAGKVS